MGLWEVLKCESGVLKKGFSALIKAALERTPRPFHRVRASSEDAGNEEEGSCQTRLCWWLDLGLSGLQNCEK